MTDTERYNALLNAGIDIVEEDHRTSKFDYAEMAAKAGCDPDAVTGFFKSRKPLLSGKDWERLITYFTLPEKWISRANVTLPENITVVSGVGSSDQVPSPGMQDKVRNVLPTATWFYQESTRRVFDGEPA